MSTRDNMNENINTNAKVKENTRVNPKENAKVNENLKTRELTYIALFVAFISVSAQLAIPLGPVPFTLQTMLILMAGLILGSKKGTICVLVYILLGAVGIPVFSGFTGGLSTIFLNTGGFIMSFPLMAYVAGKFSNQRKTLLKYLGCTMGVVLNFACGLGYFMFLTQMDLITSMTYTVFPFIITSIFQIIIAVNLSNKLQKTGNFNSI